MAAVDIADDIFKLISSHENCRILITISLELVPNGRINNNPVLAHKKQKAQHRTDDKPLSEAMMILAIHAYIRHSASTS